jgi:4-hydroxythreonine-4-phosphate dehydrogenase
LVTAPIDKSYIQGEDFNFPGHTEFLANYANTSEYLMLLLHRSLRVGTVTSHIPLNEVSKNLTQESILEKLRVLHRSLFLDFSIKTPQIAVLGLNPHAGDNGLLGSEEKDIIIPAVAKANDEGIRAFGPYAADGLFGSKNLSRFDAVLAMYHDQGLAPFKALAFGNGVNFTAGLPIVRTSPDHGTAFDIAGKNAASPSSFLAAIFSAVDIYHKRSENRDLEESQLRVSGKKN